MGISTSSPAVSALSVRRSREGGQSTSTRSKGLPSSRTSYMQPLAPAEAPSPLVALPWGSMSTMRIFSPNPARYAARLIAVVLLPTPPFWFTMATTVATAGILARLLKDLSGFGTSSRGLYHLSWTTIGFASRFCRGCMYFSLLLAGSGARHLTSPTAVSLLGPAFAGIVRELRESSRIPPIAALFAVARPGTLPHAPRVSLIRARAKPLTPGTAPPPSAVLSSPGSRRQPALTGHSTPPPPADQLTRGLPRDRRSPCTLPSSPRLLRGLESGPRFGAPASSSYSRENVLSSLSPLVALPVGQGVRSLMVPQATLLPFPRLLPTGCSTEFRSANNLRNRSGARRRSCLDP